MIDIHCHLLPGMDDGPGDTAESVTLARSLVAQGVETVVATPHVSTTYPNSPERIKLAVETLRHDLPVDCQGLQILAAAELSAAAALTLPASALRAHAVVGRFLLVEPPRPASLSALDLLCEVVTKANLRPVFVHPERSRTLSGDVAGLGRLKSLGAVFQVNASSLVGSSVDVSRRAWRLVSAGVADVVASDSHSATRRPPLLAQAHSALSNAAGTATADRLLWETPYRMLAEGDPPERARSARGGSSTTVRHPVG